VLSVLISVITGIIVFAFIGLEATAIVLIWGSNDNAIIIALGITTLFALAVLFAYGIPCAFNIYCATTGSKACKFKDLKSLVTNSIIKLGAVIVGAVTILGNKSSMDLSILQGSSSSIVCTLYSLGYVILLILHIANLILDILQLVFALNASKKLSTN
jgi:hypothetical protein